MVRVCVCACAWVRDVFLSACVHVCMFPMCMYIFASFQFFSEHMREVVSYLHVSIHQIVLQSSTMFVLTQVERTERSRNLVLSKLWMRR